MFSVNSYFVVTVRQILWRVIHFPTLQVVFGDGGRDFAVLFEFPHKRFCTWKSAVQDAHSKSVCTCGNLEAHTCQSIQVRRRQCMAVHVLGFVTYAQIEILCGTCEVGSSWIRWRDIFEMSRSEFAFSKPQARGMFLVKPQKLSPFSPFNGT